MCMWNKLKLFKDTLFQTDRRAGQMGNWCGSDWELPADIYLLEMEGGGESPTQNPLMGTQTETGPGNGCNEVLVANWKKKFSQQEVVETNTSPIGLKWFWTSRRRNIHEDEQFKHSEELYLCQWNGDMDHNTCWSVCRASSPLHPGTLSILQWLKEQNIPLKSFKPFELPVRQRLAQKVNIKQKDNNNNKKTPQTLHNEILKTKGGENGKVPNFLKHNKWTEFWLKWGTRFPSWTAFHDLRPRHCKRVRVWLSAATKFNSGTSNTKCYKSFQRRSLRSFWQVCLKSTLFLHSSIILYLLTQTCKIPLHWD